MDTPSTPPPPTTSQPDSLEKNKYDDLVRRLDHHASVLRTSPTDFFKTSVLAQASALFTILALIFNATRPSNSDPATAAHVSATLGIPLQIVMIILGLGILLSVGGYVTCYAIARTQQKRLRKAMNRYLFDGKPIGKVKDPYYHVVPWFIALSLLQLALLIIVIGWFIGIAWTLL